MKLVLRLSRAVAESVLRNMQLILFQAEVDNGLSGAAATVDFAAHSKQVITVNQDTTITIGALPGRGNFQLRIVQNGVGGHAVTIAGLSANKWIAAAAQPAVNLNPEGESLLSIYNDGLATRQSLVKVGAV